MVNKKIAIFSLFPENCRIYKNLKIFLAILGVTKATICKKKSLFINKKCDKMLKCSYAVTVVIFVIEKEEI